MRRPFQGGPGAVCLAVAVALVITVFSALDMATPMHAMTSELASTSEGLAAATTPQPHAMAPPPVLLASAPASETHVMAPAGGAGMATLPILLLGGGLALLHLIGTRLPLFSIIPLFRWTSFAGGVSITYVFLEVFPGLANYQAHLEAIGSPLGFVHNHIYLMALVGLVAFYTLDIARDRRLATQRRTPVRNPAPLPHPIFWIRLGAFAILNVIFGYLLQDLGHHTVLGCLLFFLAVGLHFFIIDTAFHEHFGDLFDRYGRWLLAAAVLLGTALGFVINVDATALAVVWAFLAGSIILNVLKRELPEANQTCYRSFLFGCGLFMVLVLVA